MLFAFCVSTILIFQIFSTPSNIPFSPSMTPKTPTSLALWRASLGTETVPLGKTDVLQGWGGGGGGRWDNFRKSTNSKTNTCKTRPPQQPVVHRHSGGSGGWGVGAPKLRVGGAFPSNTRSRAWDRNLSAYVCVWTRACVWILCLHVCAYMCIKRFYSPKSNFIYCSIPVLLQLYLSIQKEKAVLASGECVIDVCWVSPVALQCNSQSIQQCYPPPWRPVLQKYIYKKKLKKKKRVA